MMSNEMDLYRAFLDARSAAEHLLIADCASGYSHGYPKEYHIKAAITEITMAANKLGFDLVKRGKTEEATDTIASLQAEIKEAREILAGTSIGSLPNDYPLKNLALDMWDTLQSRTLDGLALIGKNEALCDEISALKKEISTQKAEEAA